ncbi:DUF2892 domain-containing protein [Archangium minus]|uniref:DUF2892 domain-containing protein n=1 Tax=Archangium minus TaxID=83450 RepID=A0ABY9WWV1_9BACT|nr:DUF2892 domain-containing protein [Archangium minus]
MTEKSQEPFAPTPRGPVPKKGAARKGILDEPSGAKGKRAVSRKEKHEASAPRESAPSSSKINVGAVERVASTVLGGTLLTLGVGRRSLGGAARAARTILGGGLLYRGVRGYCHLYQALGINTAKDRGQGEAGVVAGPIELQRSITIGKPADELYRAWREARNLSQILGHFAEVTAVGSDRQHWKVSGPVGKGLEWDSRIVDERPGELLSWESLPGADLPNDGSVIFRPAPGEWGTVVTLHFRFNPPGGVIGEAAVKLLGIVPDTLAFTTLRRFKSLVETGEIPTTAKNTSGRASAHTH